MAREPSSSVKSSGEILAELRRKMYLCRSRFLLRKTRTSLLMTWKGDVEKKTLRILRGGLISGTRIATACSAPSISSTLRAEICGVEMLQCVSQRAPAMERERKGSENI